MSNTVLAIAYTGEFQTEVTFRNGWGSGPFIWDKLCDQFEIPGMMLERWENLFAYHKNREAMFDYFEHNTLVTTYDKAVVRRDDMLTVAEGFELFVKKYQRGAPRVCTLPVQATAIRTAHAEDAEFLTWNQTTSGDSWWVHVDRETDHVTYYDPHFGTKHWIASIKPLAAP
jgi:hypothetical protein